MRLSARVVAVVIAMGLGAPGVSARQKSPQNANYTLTATLDPATHTIHGSGRLTWRNIAAVPATELRFHMYWNAWRDRSSSWFRDLREPAGGRADSQPAAIDLTSLARVHPGGKQDLLPRVRYIAPDDGNTNDRTVVSVPLETPINPGGVVDLDLAWTARVPRTIART